MFNLKNTNKTIQDIDTFFDTIDETILVFKSGVKNYLYNNTEQFPDFVNAYPKNHLRTTVQYVDVVS